jgi:hypothetical protein
MGLGSAAGAARHKCRPGAVKKNFSSCIAFEAWTALTPKIRYRYKNLRSSSENPLRDVLAYRNEMQPAEIEIAAAAFREKWLKPDIRPPCAVTLAVPFVMLPPRPLHSDVGPAAAAKKKRPLPLAARPALVSLAPLQHHGMYTTLKSSAVTHAHTPVFDMHNNSLVSLSF